MSKSKIRFVCSQCGSVSPKWLGRCPDCAGYNTFAEELAVSAKDTLKLPRSNSRPVSLMDVKGVEELRYPTGLKELDLVLGGGVVKGSVVLIGGEPGVGKSTIMLQIAGVIAGSGKRLLYVSGEESPQQISLRASRLGVREKNIGILTSLGIEEVIAQSEGYDFLIVDSVQTMASAEIPSAAGTVGQVRHITYKLVETAKTVGLTVFIVGQVTKEGGIAGPKVLEHLVDTVLYFEGDYNRGIRLLRAVKNRFGSANEVGLFEMTSKGLVEVSGDLFLSHGEVAAGKADSPVMEGSRAFLVEIQALVSPTFFQYPRRTVSGIDLNRLLMLIAVLEKRGGLSLSGADVFINVAGGLKLTETASDAAVCAAVISSLSDKAIPNGAVFMGEAGLSGELRPVSNIESRVNEALRMGANFIYTPNDIRGEKIRRVTSIRELLSYASKNYK